MNKIHQRLTDKAQPSAQSTIIYQAVGILVFVMLGFVIYSNTLNSPFILDDLQNIKDNPHIRLTELTLRNILTSAFESFASHRPVANISFALNYYFHQYNLIGYHCTNIAIHILTAIFLYFFIKNTLSISSLPSKYGNYKQIAYFTALLWLVHPVQTQSVTYIVQRMNSMASMFYILSLLFYVKGRIANRQDNRSWLWFTGCILSGVLAIGSKQIAVTLPVFILLYEWYFLQDLKASWLERYTVLIAGIIVIFVFLGFLYFGPNPFERILSSYKYRDFTLTERVLTQPRVVVHYISLLFYPHPGRLNLDYDFAISKSLISPITTLPCIGVIISLLVVAVCIAKRERLLSFCILWFFGNLVIESSVIGLEIAFEHRLYLPSMLTCLLVVVLAWRYIKEKRVWLATFLILTVLFSIWTYQRNSVWSDEVTLWRDCVAKSPNKGRPNNNLSEALFSQGKFDESIHYCHRTLQLEPDLAEAHNNLANALASQGKFDEAIAHYRQALQNRPNFVEAHCNLGTTLVKQDKLNDAIYHYSQALKINPLYAQAHCKLGIALESQGKDNEAINHYRQALRLKPDDIEAHDRLANALAEKGRYDEAIVYYQQILQLNPNLAEAHYNLGVTLAEQGKIDEAIGHYRQAIKLKPDYTDAYNNLGNILASAGKFNESVNYYRQALQNDPNLHLTHCNLGTALMMLGKADEALKHFKQAEQLKPDWAAPLDKMAWILATNPNANIRNSNEAIQLAERATKLTNHQNAMILNTLAAGYASAGRFSEAIATTEKALKLVQSPRQRKLADKIRKCMDLYKAGQPYIESSPKVPSR